VADNIVSQSYKKITQHIATNRVIEDGRIVPGKLNQNTWPPLSFYF